MMNYDSDPFAGVITFPQENYGMDQMMMETGFLSPLDHWAI